MRALPIALALAVCASGCGGDGAPIAGPSPTSNAFLAGTWAGSMTIQRRDKPPVLMSASVRFQEVPLTGGLMFSGRMTYDAGWLPELRNPVDATVVPPGPGQKLSVFADFASCHGGSFTITATADVTRIHGTLGGVNCTALFPESSVYDGTITLTKRGN